MAKGKKQIPLMDPAEAIKTLNRASVLATQIANNIRELRSVSKNFKPMRRLLKTCDDVRRMDIKAKKLAKKS